MTVVSYDDIESFELHLRKRTQKKKQKKEKKKERRSKESAKMEARDLVKNIEPFDPTFSKTVGETYGGEREERARWYRDAGSYEGKSGMKTPRNRIN